MPAASFDRFLASAPGKTILFGEHAVVHGTHAIATVVDYRCFAEFAPARDPGTVVFSQPNFNKLHEYPLHTLQAVWARVEAKFPRAPHAFPCDEELLFALTLAKELESDAAGLVFLVNFLCNFHARLAVHVVVRTEIPLGAGLGSSAAFSVALGAGFFHLGNSGGSDRYTACVCVCVCVCAGYTCV
jgi:mevalonate kinase